MTGGGNGDLGVGRYLNFISGTTMALLKSRFSGVGLRKQLKNQRIPSSEFCTKIERGILSFGGNFLLR